MADQREALADGILRETDRLAGNRGTFESHWQEIAERIDPMASGMFTQGNVRTPGEKRTEFVFDSTASTALGRFAAILDSLLTPRNGKWHRLVPSDPALLKDRAVRLWFEEATRRLFRYRYAAKANFSGQNQQNYRALGAYGTGVMFIDALDGEPGLRYRAIHLGEALIDENHQGIVDRLYRPFSLTARQARQKWGEDGITPKMKAALQNNPDQSFKIVHCVKPREDVQYGVVGPKGKPFAAYYVARDERFVLGENGYPVFPYAVSRYEQALGETYGRSPAMNVLPAIKTLNEEKKTLLKQGHRAVDPVLLTHDDGIIDGFDLRPGALNPGGVSKEGKLLVQTLPVGNIVVSKELMDDERLVINDTFLVTLFQILVETPTMTATEVLERTREKGILLAPTVGRQQDEYLGPLIEREVDLLAQQGLIDPPPPALIEAKGEYRIEYDSPLSRTQRAEEGAGVSRTVEQALAIVNVTQNPAPLDHFDWDKIMPELADINGVPVRWMRDPKAVEAIRQARAQQAQMAQATQAAPAAAALVSAGAKAKQAGVNA